MNSRNAAVTARLQKRTGALQVKCDPADRKTGSRVVRRDLRAKLPSFQSRMEQTESTDCCQAVRAKVLLFCYWLTSPKINTHLVFVPMYVLVYAYNTSQSYILYISVNFPMTKSADKHAGWVSWISLNFSLVFHLLEKFVILYNS